MAASAHRFGLELSLASRELTRVRQDVAHSDSGVLSALTPVRERAAASRASAYVWLAAMLERVVRDSLVAAFKEISSHAPTYRDYRLSLFALLCESDFESVVAKSRSGAWGKKVAMLERTMDGGTAVLSEHILPLDGRTIRADHFDAIWLVLGIPGSSTPGPLHRIALGELADGRNEVAHGHQDPVGFGRKKATSDLLKLADRVDEVILHFLSGLDEYIVNRRYKR
jgi:hypothetical protein